MSLDIHQTTARHADKLADPAWGLYFHGTASPFAQVDFSHVGTASDANATLGFFVTDVPKVAISYADIVREDRTGVVLAVLVREAAPFEFSSFAEFYGASWPHSDPSHTQDHFRRLRGELIARGHDSAWFGLDDDGLIGIALAPEHAVILGCVTREAVQGKLDAVHQELVDQGSRVIDTAYKQAITAAIKGFVVPTLVA